MSYKVYAAIMSQSGTDAPVAAVLENTLGDETVIWTRGDVGNYLGTLAGAFPATKTPQMNSAYIDGDRSGYLISRLDDNTVELSTIDRNGNSLDELLNSTFVEIRVYP